MYSPRVTFLGVFVTESEWQLRFEHEPNGSCGTGFLFAGWGQAGLVLEKAMS